MDASGEETSTDEYRRQIYPLMIPNYINRGKLIIKHLAEKPMKNIITLILLLSTMTACTSASTVVKTPQITSSNSVIIQPTETITLLTNTLNPTETALPTVTATPVINVVMQELQVIKELPEGTEITGCPVLLSVFIDDSPSEVRTEQVHIVDVTTGNERTLAPEGLSAENPFVSPDGNWIAYEIAPGWPTVVPNIDDYPDVWTDRLLVVEDTNGNEIFRTPFREGWGSISQWFNQAIGVRRAIIGAWSSASTIMLTIDPFSGVITDLPPDPDDLYNLINAYYAPPLGWVVYDPTLTRRAYPTVHDGLVLENMETLERIGNYQVSDDSPPRWSPDGQWFVIDKLKFNGSDYYDDELFLISRDGEESQLTHFSSDYPSVERITHYVWSPDGTKIAFLVQLQPDLRVNPNLAVIDVTTKKVTIYDIQSSFYSDTDPVWSLNGQQILITVPYGDQEANVGLVDLNENWIIEIAENKIPKGWLNTP